MSRLAATLPLVFVAAIAAAEEDADTGLVVEIVGTWHVVSFLDDDAEKIKRLGGIHRDEEGALQSAPKLIVAADGGCGVLENRGKVKRNANGHLTNCGWDSYTLDASVDPAAIDLVGVDREGEEIVYPGIVKIEDGRLHIAWAESGKPRTRPTAFASDGDDNLFVCERIAAEPEEIPPLPSAKAEVEP